jgi:hypothetical protein
MNYQAIDYNVLGFNLVIVSALTLVYVLVRVWMRSQR